MKKLLIALTALLSFYQAHPDRIPKEPLKLGVVVMQTDYKFWYIKRDDDGFITDAAVRFYEGLTTTQNELKYPSATSSEQVLMPVTRYRRSRRLGSADLGHLAKLVNGKMTVRMQDEVNGNLAVLYNQGDFGKIKTDDELRSFLNKELAKDKTRTPIPEEINL